MSHCTLSTHCRIDTPCLSNLGRVLLSTCCGFSDRCLSSKEAYVLFQEIFLDSCLFVCLGLAWAFVQAPSLPSFPRPAIIRIWEKASFPSTTAAAEHSGPVFFQHLHAFVTYKTPKCDQRMEKLSFCILPFEAYSSSIM